MKITRRNMLKAAALAAGGFAAGGAAALALRRRPRSNIVLVIHDALRADHVGAKRAMNGAARSLTPFIDTLASRATAFQLAMAPSSWTPISLGSILYGVPPTQVWYSDTFQVHGGSSLVGELRQAGYRTAAVIANSVLDAPVIREGFDAVTMLRMPEVWKIDSSKPKGAAVNREVAKLAPFLRDSGRFFLYVHYVDTHEQYNAVPEVVTALGGSYDGRLTTTKARKRYTGADGGGSESADSMIERLGTHYDASVYYADLVTRDLVDMLTKAGLFEETLLIVTSDHGEEFADGETPEWRNIGHGYNLCHSAIHVPLIVGGRGDRIPAAASAPQPVSLRAAIGDAVARYSGGEDLSEWALRASLEDPEGGILSYLSWRGQFSGLAYMLNNVKVTARTGEDSRLLEPKAYRLGGAAGVAAVPVPSQMAAAAEKAVAGSEGATFEPSMVNGATREQLRALGYLQ